ncbi:MAG: ATP-dependent Clp protease proteolytic subunit [Myxococcales bacterium]
MSEQAEHLAEALARAGGMIADTLFAARSVLIVGEVTPALAERVAAQLMALAARGSEPIRLVLHSPGGHVESGDTIHDMIRFIQPEVHIVGTGWVASAGALIYCAVPRERRLCLPNTRFLLHEPSGGYQGQAADIAIEAEQMLAMRTRLQSIFARATGQTPERIARDSARNHWLGAQEAMEYGLVGRIVEHVGELSRPR